MYDYTKEKEALREFLAGTRTAAEIKGVFSPYGIYQQKNGLFMMRLRINGGRVSRENLQKVIEIAKCSKARFLHLTTREAIQLHDVEPTRIEAVIDLCLQLGLPFRGGGGDTFRNILTSPLGGLRKESVFDVYPYAEELKKYIFSVESAFHLPRKIKIAMFDAPQDERFVRVQDLGFLAIKKDGMKGFRVWGGGGIGRNSAEGVLLLDFIPVAKAAAAAKAMIDLFSEHGNRTNRAMARIRYIVKALGAEEFKKLYLSYFEKAEAPDLKPEFGKSRERLLSKSFSAHLNPGLDAWKRLNTSPSTKPEESLVHVRIPHGNLRVKDLEAFHWIMEKYALAELRLTPARDFYFVDFPTDALPALYDDLLKLLPKLDTTLKSFAGQIVTCIGCTVCKIGIRNSPELGDSIGAALDAYFDGKEEEKIRLADQIIDKIRISGCPSCCTTHPMADIGLNGLIKNGAPCWQFYQKENPDQILGTPEAEPTGDGEAVGKIMARLGLC